VTRPDPQIRHEVVDPILAQFERDLTPEEEALLATATMAEWHAALEVSEETADEKTRILKDLIEDPSRLIDDIGFMTLMPEPDSCQGLAKNAHLLLFMQAKWPWSPEQREQVARLTRGWSPQDWQLAAERLGPECQRGFHRL
jgi:hypothetical protein